MHRIAFLFGTLLLASSTLHAQALPAPAPTTRAEVIAARIEQTRHIMRALAGARQVKVVYSEFWQANGAAPAGMADLGLADPLPLTTAQATIEGGAIVLTFNAPLAGETLALAPWHAGGRPDALQWTCGMAKLPENAQLVSAVTAAELTSLREGLTSDCR